MTPAELSMITFGKVSSSPSPLVEEKHFANAGTPTASMLFLGFNATPNIFVIFPTKVWSGASEKPVAAHYSGITSFDCPNNIDFIA